MAADILTLAGLSARYHGIRAIDDISLRVRQGSVTALIGANGAGKSTLLNVVSGLVPASGGAVTFDGRAVTNMRADRVAKLGLLQVPEGRQILGPLSVEENLLIGQLALGSRADQRFDVERVFDLFPILKEKRSHQGRSLSGGQQQMLAVGRALMGGPRLLMLDEPSLGLAPMVVDEVFGRLTELNRQGLSLLLVEQNARRALAASDYVYVLDQGSVVRHGPSTEVANDAAVIEAYLGSREPAPDPRPDSTARP